MTEEQPSPATPTGPLVPPAHSTLRHYGLCCVARTFFRNEQPSVRRALPPVGWHSTVEQPLQMTTVCAWLNTVVLRESQRGTQRPLSFGGECASGGGAAAGECAWVLLLARAHVEATGALHVHEEGVGRLHEALELVAALLKLTRRMQQVDIAHGDVRLRANDESRSTVSRWIHAVARAVLRRDWQRAPALRQRPPSGVTGIGGGQLRRRARRRT